MYLTALSFLLAAGAPLTVSAHGIPSVRQSRSALGIRFGDGAAAAAPEPRPLRKRAECGSGLGSCTSGQCCSQSGFCGTTGGFCGSGCQLDYSDSCDTVQSPSGDSTINVDRPHVGSVPYGSAITQCTVPNTMALTFDDGPWTYTDALLDILSSKGVKATFFINGNNKGKGMIDVESNGWASTVRRMYNDGHQIASHTWSHRDLNVVPETIQYSEMVYNEMAIRNIFGFFPTYMRPPYAYCYWSTGCVDVMNTLGYHIVNMDVDTKDYLYDSAAGIQTAKDRFTSGWSPDGAGHITLAHDTLEQTIMNLTAHMIDLTLNRGYTLTTVGDCLGDPEDNWYRSDGGGGVSPPDPEPPTPTPTTTTCAPPVTSVITITTTTTVCGSSPSECTQASNPAQNPSLPSISLSSSEDSSSSSSSPSSSSSAYSEISSSSSSVSISSTFSSESSSTTSSSSSSISSSSSSSSPTVLSSSSSISDTSSSSAPTSTVVVSPDQTCGAANGYTCLGSSHGNCCSYWDHCGSTPEYCGTGCNPEFGECDTPPAGVSTTTNGLCGDAFGTTCDGYLDGDKPCCSRYGYCGSSDGYCMISAGCLSGFSAGGACY